MQAGHENRLIAVCAVVGDSELGPLDGIPYAAKDLFDVRGLPTTAGTRLLGDNIAQTDAAVVAMSRIGPSMKPAWARRYKNPEM